MKIQIDFNEAEKERVSDLLNRIADFCELFDCGGITCDTCPFNKLSERVAAFHDQLYDELKSFGATKE